MTRCFSCMREYDDKLNKCPHCGFDNNTKPSEPYHISLGSILEGRYLVGKVVGQGGFGITYIGWDLQLERKVAIKEYFPSDFATRAYGEQKLTVYKGESEEQFENGLKSFIDEAQRLAKFNGIKGIVDIYDTFISNNTGYIIMEFLSGISLKEMLKANKQIDYPTAKEIVIEILYILKEVHKDSIIHRDIAPDNIFITDDGEFKLLDFGAARYATTTHSKSLSVILKPGYAPEEQYRSRGNQGPWTDIYALAATFYKLITGITPPESMERRTGDNLVPPSKLGVNIPKNDEIALLNALNILPENRTQSAQEFLDDLGGKKVVRKKERNLYKDTGKMYRFIIPLISASLLIVAAFFIGVKLGIINLTYWGTVIEAKASLPEGYAVVPNVIGLKEDDAAGMLKALKFNYEIGEAFYSDIVDEGEVAAQTPSIGAELEETKIILIKSLGAKKASLGLFKNRKFEEVANELKRAGFYNVNREIGKKNDIIEGTIEDIEIDGKVQDENVEVKLSSNIKIYVSTGENFKIDETNEVNVPVLVGKKYTSVQKQLTASKLVIGRVSEEYSNTVEKGYIISQSPSGGKVKEGSSISFVVSRGKKDEEKVAIPNVTNMNENAAINAVRSSRLNPSVDYKYDNNVRANLVISQSPSAGKEVKPGTTVRLVVSRGAEPAPVPAPVPIVEATRKIEEPVTKFSMPTEAERITERVTTEPRTIERTTERTTDALYPNDISLDRKKTTVGIDERVRIRAKVYPDNVRYNNIDWEVDGSGDWETSADTIWVSFPRAGSYTVKAVAENGIYASCTVVVENNYDVSVDPDYTYLSGGDTVTIRANCDETVNWSVSGSDLVSYSSDGNVIYVTAKNKGSGTAIVTASSSSDSDSCTIEVENYEPPTEPPIKPTPVEPEEPPVEQPPVETPEEPPVEQPPVETPEEQPPAEEDVMEAYDAGEEGEGYE